jgi:hypothetical protein
MSTYQNAAPPIYDRVRNIIDKFHPDLAKAEVKVDILFAFAPLDQNDKPRGSAITHGGYAADGLCRILPLKDRVMGRGDAEIILDGDNWNHWTKPQQDALLDHELFHLQVRANQAGVVFTDDIERPVLKMRKHDRQMGWFDEMARRWGPDSCEVRQARELVETGACYFQSELTFQNQDA